MTASLYQSGSTAGSLVEVVDMRLHSCRNNQGRAIGGLANCALPRAPAVILTLTPQRKQCSPPASSARARARAGARAGEKALLTSSAATWRGRSEEHTSELQSRQYLVCR